MKLIDTNIIIYSIGKVHPLREKCREVMEKAAKSEIAVNVDVEVLQELLYVYSSRGERRKGILTVSDILVLFPSPVSITKEEIFRAKELMDKYDFLVPRDAIHAAAVLTNRFEGLISTDKVFEEIREIKRFEPEVNSFE